MMGPRYFAFVGPAEQVVALERRAGQVARASGLAPVFRQEGIAVFAEPGDGPVPCAELLVLGTLFERATGRSVGDRWERRLIRHHWGSYVAFVLDPHAAGWSIVRAPFGELGCYYWSDGALVVAASDVALLCAWAGATPPIDWAAVAGHLIAPDLRPSATCLSGIQELLGGTCLRIANGSYAVEELWSPWAYVGRADDADLDTLATGLRAVTTECIGRIGGGFSRVLVALSGGLDSSIVAASLAATGVPFECMTLVTADALGDERPFARAVTDALGVRLSEAPRLVAGVDVGRSNAAHLPRPVGRYFAQESERHFAAIARAAGADAILRGGGGDNVFCYIQSVRPIVDRIRRQGWIPALETLGDVCRLTGCSAPTAVHRTLRRLRRPPAYPVAVDTSLLSRELLAETPVGPSWRDAPDDALPGQAAHVASVLTMANYMEPLAPELRLPLLSPLMSQPIVEFCLGVPSWLWCRGGNNRMVARRAFAGDLPKAIVKRRGKGAPDSFEIEIYEANRAALRELLEDGLLAAHGLIDMDGVRAVLADTRPVRGIAYSRVMQLGETEAWARSWTGRRVLP
ncbi:asparagine synthetase B family protein [Sphingomonas sp.]|uniref:asparagine synthase-related protein n=1 Tax=Sphingomonas sp. TaxID=28214 RepID=UPI001B294BD9|nr:asparagine synthetase B family protein [Sphingomonas sp.]MBO9712499.1 hypothetical protein [Sphingomonas sp.]